MGSKVIAVIGIHDKVEHMPNDTEEIARKARDYEMARKLVSTLSSSKGGMVVGLIEGNEIVELPTDSADILKEIHQRLLDEFGLEAEIGVGEDSHEAFAALKYAKKNAKGCIKVYRPEYDEESSSENTGLSQDIKDALGKSENYKPVNEADRQKIAQLIMMMQDNKDTFDQMKQQAPEVYGGVVSLVQSITAILQYDKVAKEQNLVEMIGKINEQVQKEKQKTMKGHGKEIDRHLKRQEKNAQKDQEDKLDSLSDSSSKMRNMRRRDASRFAHENGHDDPQFLMRLLSAFRD